MTIVPVTSADLDGAEVSWFSALCSDDYELLGVPDGALRSSWAHCRDIVLEAEKQGFRNILCPSSYQVGQDTLSFVAGMAPLTSRINFLAAVRCQLYVLNVIIAFCHLFLLLKITDFGRSWP